MIDTASDIRRVLKVGFCPQIPRRNHGEEGMVVSIAGINDPILTKTTALPAVSKHVTWVTAAMSCPRP